MNYKKLFKRLFGSFFLLILLGFLLPQKLIIPVKGANHTDWNDQTFWYEPWGSSLTHKGIDIFAKEGTPILSATYGIVLSRSSSKKGGKTIVVLGPKWRIHYYAHLKTQAPQAGIWLSKGEVLGYVGTTGNAKGKPPHLHYSLGTLIPYPWRADDATQGWMKVFILNPLDYLPKS